MGQIKTGDAEEAASSEKLILLIPAFSFNAAFSASIFGFSLNPRTLLILYGTAEITEGAETAEN